MELLVEPLKLNLKVESGMNLLDVLTSHQVPISHSCMSGKCGMCRCKVLDGHVHDNGPVAGRPQLGKDSYVLACQSVIAQSCTIEVPEVDEIVVHPARILKATVTRIEDVTHDIRRIMLKSNKPLDFSPGQYVTLQFTPDHVRPYSLAGLATDVEMEFHIRNTPGGHVTDHVFHQLKLGDAVKVSGPQGTAFLRQKHTGPMLCVGGGTGLAPILSIVRGALEAGMRNPMHLYFGVRSEDDVYDAQRLEALSAAHDNLHVHIVVAGGASTRGHRSGLLTDAIAQDHPSLVGWNAYLCGAPAMVEAVNLVVSRLGVEAGQIHADAFYPSGV